MIITIFVTSFIFLDFQKIDRDYEKEVFSITKFISSKTAVINDDSADIKYRTASNLILNWPNLPATTGEAHIERTLIKIPISDEKSLFEFIDSSKNKDRVENEILYVFTPDADFPRTYVDDFSTPPVSNLLCSSLILCTHITFSA